MRRFIYLVTIISLLLFTMSGAVVRCKQEAKIEKQIKINFGTALASNDEINALSRAIKEAVERYMPQFNVVSVENLRGTDEVIQNVVRYDLSGINLDEAAQAYYGFFAWNGKTYSQLRLLWVMGILPVAFLVAKDARIKSIYELEGKPYGNSGKEDRVDFKAKKLLEALKIKPRWSRESLKAQIDLYKGGRFAGFIEYGANQPLLSECRSHRPFIVLEISELELTKVSQHYKGTVLIYPPAMIRGGASPNQEENIIHFGR